MTNEIALTAALRSNLLSLQDTQGLLDRTQLRLATGKKINSALDNPSAFFAAAGLNSRAGDLSNLLDAMGQGVQKLKATDQGIKSLTALVTQAQAIAQTAQNSLSNSGFVRSGDIAAASVANLTAAAFNNNDAFTVSVGGVSAGTITISTGETLAQLASALSGLTGVSAQVVDGTFGSAAGAKRLEIRATNGQTITLTDAVVGTVAKLQANNGGAGGAVGMRGDTGGVIATGVPVASTSNVPDAISLEGQYRIVRTQIDTLIGDSSYQGTNLLNGDTLSIQFNEKNTSKLVIAGVTFTSTGLGISYAASAGGATTGTFLNATNVTASINEITNALTTIRNQAATFGTNLNIVQTRQDFTQNIINALKAGADALTLADKNEEGANLLALQTSQQLGITSLSLASQANQAVLRLFQ